jgi:chromosome segregation ATPase
LYGKPSTISDPTNHVGELEEQLRAREDKIVTLEKNLRTEAEKICTLESQIQQEKDANEKALRMKDEEMQHADQIADFELQKLSRQLEQERKKLIDSQSDINRLRREGREHLKNLNEKEEEIKEVQVNSRELAVQNRKLKNDYLPTAQDDTYFKTVWEDIHVKV